jgi:hypothetical protein
MPVDTGSLTIGFPRESGTERRTILTPGLARQLADAGFTVIAEPGIGAGVFTGDDEYAAAGACLASPDEAWSAPLVLRYKSAHVPSEGEGRDAAVGPPVLGEGRRLSLPPPLGPRILKRGGSNAANRAGRS